jgi:hypothetical protein
MNTQPFNAAEVIADLQQQRVVRRQRHYGRSRLNKYRAQIVALLQQPGGSYRLVTEWLRIQKHIRVSHTTVMRYAKQLSELQETKQETQDAQLS